MSDLPKYSCFHCRGHQEEPKLKLGELYKSTSMKTCSICDHKVQVGERLATDGNGGHVCEDCYKDEIAANATPDEVNL